MTNTREMTTSLDEKRLPYKVKRHPAKISIKSMQRKRLIVQGQVQGVGFRPFVYRLAHEIEITGFVGNTPQGVIIEIQGNSNVDSFIHKLTSALPPLASITDLQEETLDPVQEETGFYILKSTDGEGHSVLISPDVATCDDCMEDMQDPENRRYRYPFTNCTNCGPRYTITRSIPYDRPQTSMACFPLCPECLKEYEDPLDRRFHAQPNACPACGPEVWLADSKGNRLAGKQDALDICAQKLAAGKLFAVKGLGGFHLVCNALDQDVVAELRRRKNRWDKPLAIMVPDIDTAGQLVRLSKDEKSCLSGRQRPILLCESLEHPELAPGLAPDTNQLGIMLPYTPLHHILFQCYRDSLPQGALPVLVMTSGNASSEPIALGNREALKRLSSIADFFLFHNRDILLRCDDSVLRFHARTQQPEFFRRARGYTPSPVFLPSEGPPVMGLGPQLKATVCLTKNDQAFVSQHIGDMENLETYSYYRETILHLQDILQTSPQGLVADLHPDYLSTGYGREQTGLRLYQLQHHYAHIYAVAAENKWEAPLLGLALDGTGYGEDKTLWGGECLFIHPAENKQKRLGHFHPVLLPGGEAAIKEPWRTAQSYLHALDVHEPRRRTWPWLEQHAQAGRMVRQLLAKKLNCPQTTSCGRLFDAVSALLGLKDVISYEGQAAIVLEAVQDKSASGSYACPVVIRDGMIELDTLTLFAEIFEDWERNVPASVISRRFHLALIRGLKHWAARAREMYKISHVALSGGVMQNQTLSVELPPALEEQGLTPLLHRQVPPNDACISLGQAYYGQILLARESKER